MLKKLLNNKYTKKINLMLPNFNKPMSPIENDDLSNALMLLRGNEFIKKNLNNEYHLLTQKHVDDFYTQVIIIIIIIIICNKSR